MKSPIASPVAKFKAPKSPKSKVASKEPKTKTPKSKVSQKTAASKGSQKTPSKGSQKTAQSCKTITSAKSPSAKTDHVVSITAKEVPSVKKPNEPAGIGVKLRGLLGKKEEAIVSQAAVKQVAKRKAATPESLKQLHWKRSWVIFLAVLAALQIAFLVMAATMYDPRLNWPWANMSEPKWEKQADIPEGIHFDRAKDLLTLEPYKPDVEERKGGKPVTDIWDKRRRTPDARCALAWARIVYGNSTEKHSRFSKGYDSIQQQCTARTDVCYYHPSPYPDSCVLTRCVRLQADVFRRRQTEVLTAPLPGTICMEGGIEGFCIAAKCCTPKIFNDRSDLIDMLLTNQSLRQTLGERSIPAEILPPDTVSAAEWKDKAEEYITKDRKPVDGNLETPEFDYDESMYTPENRAVLRQRLNDAELCFGKETPNLCREGETFPWKIHSVGIVMMHCKGTKNAGRYCQDDPLTWVENCYGVCTRDDNNEKCFQKESAPGREAPQCFDENGVALTREGLLCTMPTGESDGSKCGDYIRGWKDKFTPPLETTNNLYSVECKPSGICHLGKCIVFMEQTGCLSGAYGVEHGYNQCRKDHRNKIDQCVMRGRDPDKVCPYCGDETKNGDGQYAFCPWTRMDEDKDDARMECPHRIPLPYLLDGDKCTDVNQNDEDEENQDPLC